MKRKTPGRQNPTPGTEYDFTPSRMPRRKPPAPKPTPRKR